MIIPILASIIVFITSLFVYDSSDLTHYFYTGNLIDKWHEEQCYPMYDDKGTYLGENCSDIYTVVILVNGKKVTETVSNKAFNNLLIGSTVNYEYDLGKLHWQHNLKIETIK